MKRQTVLSVLSLIVLGAAGIPFIAARASDHDDGENDMKSRALNLTDHYVWKDATDATKINFVQTTNPRSLAGQQYFFSSTARYSFHVTRVTDKKAGPTGSDDIELRFEFSAPDANNVQTITFTVIKGGSVVGTGTGTTTPLAASPTVNTVSVGGVTYTFFAGLREDTFFFDVQRFFQVRDFLAHAFFGGVAATTPLHAFQTGSPTCDISSVDNTTQNYYLRGITGYDTVTGSTPITPGNVGNFLSKGNLDPVHLFNPPDCAEDFTKNYNRNEIELQAPIAALQASGETVFDTWSTIFIPQ